MLEADVSDAEQIFSRGAQVFVEGGARASGLRATLQSGNVPNPESQPIRNLSFRRVATVGKSLT